MGSIDTLSRYDASENSRAVNSRPDGHWYALSDLY